MGAEALKCTYIARRVRWTPVNSTMLSGSPGPVLKSDSQSGPSTILSRIIHILQNILYTSSSQFAVYLANDIPSARGPFDKSHGQVDDCFAIVHPYGLNARMAFCVPAREDSDSGVLQVIGLGLMQKKCKVPNRFVARVPCPKRTVQDRLPELKFMDCRSWAIVYEVVHVFPGPSSVALGPESESVDPSSGAPGRELRPASRCSSEHSITQGREI